jgi:hypothetical protein
MHIISTLGTGQLHPTNRVLTFELYDRTQEKNRMDERQMEITAEEGGTPPANLPRTAGTPNIIFASCHPGLRSYRISFSALRKRLNRDSGAQYLPLKSCASRRPTYAFTG